MTAVGLKREMARSGIQAVSPATKQVLTDILLGLDFVRLVL